MASSIQWFVDKRIIYNHFSGTLTLETITQGVEVITDMIAVGDAPIHIIFDARDLTSQPTKIKQISDAAKPVIAHAAIGTIIVVTENVLQRFLGNVVMQLFHKSSRIVATLEQGVEILERIDGSLPQLSKQVPLRDDVVVIEEGT